MTSPHAETTPESPAKSDSEQSRSSRQLRATGLMAAGTLASRLLGFVRAMLIAFVLGNGTRQVEMFTLGNTVPNMIYTLLAGGVLNTVFVPQIVRAIKKDSDGGEAYTNRMLTATLSALALLTVIGTLAVPLITRVYVSSEWQVPDHALHYDNIVLLTYLCLPQLFFYGAYAIAGQVLNAREKFGPMMWAPIANNVVAIVVFALYLAIWGTGSDTAAPFTTGQMMLIGLGSTLGIIVQAVILVPFLNASGFRFRPRFDLRGVGLGHTLHLAKWTLFFVLVTQLGLIVITRLASSGPAGGEGAGFNAYNQASLIWIMPHSLLTVSLTTAMLTSASDRAARGDLPGVAAESMRTMRIALASLLPVAVAFLALGLPVTQLLFGWGQGANDAHFLGWTLMALAVGLVPFTLNYVVQRTFYALEDTRSTFLQQVIVVVLNVTLALALVLPFHSPAWVAPALGLAYSLAYVVGFMISFRWLRTRLSDLDGWLLFRLGVRTLVAVAPGALLAFGLATLLGSTVGQLQRAGLLVFGGGLAVLSFLVLARLLHIAEVATLVGPVLRRLPSAPVRRFAAWYGRAGATGDQAAAARAASESDSEVSSINGGSVTADGPDGDPDRGGMTGREVDEMAHRAGEQVIGGAAGSLDAADEDSGLRSPDDDPPDPDSSDEDPSDPGSTEDSLDEDSADEDSAGGADPAGEAVPDEDDDTRVGHGLVLGGRYRLEELMEEHHDVATWRAYDSVLSRSVVIHLLPPADERSPEVLASARRAATATDARFLRVLDAVQSLDDRFGSYVVCEYSPGQNLTALLASGPLSALEAAWVVREVADAMSGVHSAGLHHLRIGPDTVWITPAGNVKIGDLAIRAELRPGAELDPADPATLKRGRTAFQPETDEAHDVADLGRLLYACLVHRWPGGHRYGLEAAPTNGADGWLTPRQVRHGVSPALDRICDQVLSATPRQGAPLRTATEVVNALSRVLGSADASGDLERRLQHPVPPVPPEDGSPVETTQSPLTTYREQNFQDWAPAPGDADAVPSLPAEQPPGDGNRRWVLGAIVLLLAILLVAVIAVAAQLTDARNGEGRPTTNGSPTGTVTTPPGAAKLAIVGGTDFDPQGGDKSENRAKVPLAYDGNPATGWTTDRYRGNPKFGGLAKDGVGIVVDLGAPKSITEVRLQLLNAGTDLQVMVPTADPGAVTSPPLNGVAAWRAVGQQAKAPQQLTVTLTEPVTTRYVLVLFTSLASEGNNNYRAGVNEIEVWG